MFNYNYYENYEISQYEDIVKNGKFYFREHVNARYIRQEQENYSGNLLLEALPPIKNLDKTFDFLKKYPNYSENEKNCSDEYRIHSIFRLLNFLIPLSSNLMTDQYLSIIMRNGYISKRIGTRDYWSMIEKSNRNLVKGEKNVLELSTQYSIASNSSNGFLIIGSSGCGKTSGINNSLSFYPQVIKHFLDVDGMKSFFTQIPWIRVDCSYDGRISGVCYHFFSELDLLLGTDYVHKYGRITIDKMIEAISFLSLKYAIGALVVDEIQYIKHTKNGEELFNFFVTLSNTIRIPIIYIGTYKASNTILGEQYAKGRKSEGIGSVEYYRLDSNDLEWNTFIETLWKYQWVKNITPLTQEIRDIMFKRSLGIIDRVIKIFMAVQLEAVFSGEEQITIDLINNVANNKFKLSEKIIRAFQSGNKADINLYDDIIAPDIKIEEYLNRNLATQKVNEVYNSQSFKESINKQQTIDTIIHILHQTMDFKIDDVEKVAVIVLNKLGNNKDINVLIKEVAKELLKNEIDNENNNEKQPKKKKGTRKQKVPTNFVEENIKDVLDGIR
ncbi:MAG: ATP-binding protein [Ruminiclostridium sp.]